MVFMAATPARLSVSSTLTVAGIEISNGGFQLSVYHAKAKPQITLGICICLQNLRTQSGSSDVPEMSTALLVPVKRKMNRTSREHAQWELISHFSSQSISFLKENL